MFKLLNRFVLNIPCERQKSPINGLKKILDYLLSTKETAYVTASPAGIPASLKNWIHSEVAEDKNIWLSTSLLLNDHDSNSINSD